MPALPSAELRRVFGRYRLPGAAFGLYFFAYAAILARWHSLANQFVAAPSSIGALAVSDVADRRLSRFHAERRRFSRPVQRTTLGMAAVGAVPFAAIILLAPALRPIVFGPHWVGAARSVSITAVSAYLRFIVRPAENAGLIVNARRCIVLKPPQLAALTGLGAAAEASWQAAPRH